MTSLLCDVTKHEATGKPCREAATETVRLLFKSGVAETKRVCPHHAGKIAESNAVVEANLKAKADARAEESDRRAARLAADFPPVEPPTLTSASP
jgi:hypothetical protein